MVKLMPPPTRPGPVTLLPYAFKINAPTFPLCRFRASTRESAGDALHTSLDARIAHGGAALGAALAYAINAKWSGTLSASLR